MKISEFIGKLQEIQGEFGDIDMAVHNSATGWMEDIVILGHRQHLVPGRSGVDYCLLATSEGELP